MQQIAYPFSIDGQGRAAGATYEQHIRQMIEQVLFTNSGERVNRPDFGCGILQLIFAPNSDELAAATQFLIQGSLDQWLGDLIQVSRLEVVNDDARLEITVRYTIRQTQQPQVATFSREV
ncbi:MAG: GPW/gp25 family protein [Leptolyngbya sp. SIO4C1]|nr:GPW/gp25 family protein [Leptolyngbya sp. SIO4C1]